MTTPPLKATLTTNADAVAMLRALRATPAGCCPLTFDGETGDAIKVINAKRGVIFRALWKNKTTVIVWKPADLFV